MYFPHFLVFRVFFSSSQRPPFDICVSHPASNLLLLLDCILLLTLPCGGFTSPHLQETQGTPTKYSKPNLIKSRLPLGQNPACGTILCPPNTVCVYVCVLHSLQSELKTETFCDGPSPQLSLLEVAFLLHKLQTISAYFHADAF